LSADSQNVANSNGHKWWHTRPLGRWQDEWQESQVHREKNFIFTGWYTRLIFTFELCKLDVEKINFLICFTVNFD